MEPWQEYDRYMERERKFEIWRQKETVCLNCDRCISDLVEIDGIGAFEVGFCLDKQEFLTNEEMRERTLFDCFQGEVL